MNFWLPGPKAVVAGIGSRHISVAESQLLAATGAWVLSHNGALRSGGALGADTAWIGRADIHPARVTVCLPEALASLSAMARRRLRTGIQLEGPPYPAWCEALAVAEWTFGERLCEVGLPPYTDPPVLEEFEARRGWHALRNRAVGAYIQQLMIRNARIIFPEEGRPWISPWGCSGARRTAGVPDTVSGLHGPPGCRRLTCATLPCWRQRGLRCSSDWARLRDVDAAVGASWIVPSRQ